MHMENYRSATSIIDKSQEALAATGSPEVIIKMRDVEGLYRENCTFFTYPIKAGQSTAILTRLSAEVFEVWSVLLSKGYINAKMMGHKSTRDAILKLLGELDGTVSSMLTKIAIRLDTSAPASQNGRHDTLLALQASINVWRRLFPNEDVHMPASRSLYVQWLNKVYEDDAKAGDTLIVSTIHSFKGRQAERVYIMQPDLLPLPDRIKLENHELRSWEAFEEKNVYFVALSRAKDELLKMEHIEDGLTRSGLLQLFEAPASSEGPSQQPAWSVPSSSAPSSQARCSISPSPNIRYHPAAPNPPEDALVSSI